MNKDDKCCCGPAVSTGCCSDTISSCCESRPDIKKSLVIDFLYIDLSVCERCQGTGSTLSEAIGDVKKILEVAGYDIKVNYIHVTKPKSKPKNWVLSVLQPYALTGRIFN